MGPVLGFIFYFLFAAVAQSLIWPDMQGDQLHIRYLGTEWLNPGMSLDIQGILRCS